MARGSATAIARRIEQDITAGALAPGQQLVSVRDLSEELGVSPATVASAYRRLRDRGLVVGRGRQGSRVAPRLHQPVPATTPSLDGIVDAMTGTPDQTLLPELGRAFAAVADRAPARYGDALIVPELASAAAQLFQADGIDPSNLAVTNGSMDAIERVLRAQDFRAGDRVGVEDPGHVPLHQVVRSAGFELVPIPIDDQGITVSGLANALSLGMSAMVVTPRAQNPTGAAFSKQRIQDLGPLLANHSSLMVIHDDHAGPIAGTPYVPLAPVGDRWATIRSVGKSFGPDLRLALVAGDRQTMDRVTTSFANGPGWVSQILQHATAHLLRDEPTRALVEQAAASYRDRRGELIAALAHRGVSASGRSGLNVWIPTPDEQAAVGAARAGGFAIRAADPWRISSPPAVRVTVSNLNSNQIQQIADTLAPARSQMMRPSPV